MSNKIPLSDKIDPSTYTSSKVTTPPLKKSEEVRDVVFAIIAPNGVSTEIELKKEHTNLVEKGMNGLEICKWAGEKFGISNWARGAHHGEWETLSAPEGDLTQLKAFLKNSLGIEWSLANGRSDNHPAFHLTDGYVLKHLFGEKNMEKVDKRNEELDGEWRKLGENYNAKEKYLKEKIGVNIKGDWSNLIGIRDIRGVFGGGDRIHISGSLYDDDVSRLRIDQYDSDIAYNIASSGRLFFLG